MQNSLMSRTPRSWVMQWQNTSEASVWAFNCCQNVTLNALYKVRTSRYFERHQSSSLPCPRSDGSCADRTGPSHTVNSCSSPLATLPETDLAVRHICFCAESRVLLLAAARHVCLLSFCRSDSAFEIPVLDVCLSYEEDGDGQSTVEEETAFSPGVDGGGTAVGSGVVEGSVGSTGSISRRIPPPLVGPLSSASSPLSSGSKDLKVFVTVRAGVRQWHAGYQPSFICRLGIPLALSDTYDAFSSDLATASPSTNIVHVNPPPPISAIALTSAYSLLAVGNDAGIALVDYGQAVCLLSICLPDLDGCSQTSPSVASSASPMHRASSNSFLHTALHPSSEHAPRAPHSPDRLFTQVEEVPSRRQRFMQSFRRKPVKTESIRRSRRTYEADLPLSSVLERKPVGADGLPGCGEQKTEVVFPSELELHEYLPEGTIKKRLLISPHDVWSVSPLLAKSEPSYCRLNSNETVLASSVSGSGSVGAVLFSCSPPVSMHEIAGGLDGPAAAGRSTVGRTPTRADLKRAKSQDKAMELRLQRHSGGSSQSSLDQPTAEGVRTLVFTEISGIKNGSLFRLEGEAVSIAFLDSFGEICVPPAIKWDLGSSAIPRLTLVPQQEEEEEEEKEEEAARDCTDGASARAMTDQESNSGLGDSFKPTNVTRNVSLAKILGPGSPSVRPHPASGAEPPSARRDQPAKGAGRWPALKLGAGGSGGSSPATPVLPNATPVPVTSSEEVPSVGQHAPTGSVAADMDKHFVVLCSEKQAQVIALPSRICYHKLRIPPNSGPPTGGAATSVSTNAFLACLLSNGHLLAFSLPSLRMLSDVDYMHSTVNSVPSTSLDHFTFGNLGHCIYMQSPSELVKITWATDLSSKLNEMHGEIFLPCTMPEPPKRNFFTNLFSGNFNAVDRDELSALLPLQRLDKLNAQSGSAVSDLARARNAAIERGERLAQLDTQTQEMADQSRALGKAASMLAAKYEKQDKWWGWPR
ncbi:unnamed protein product [Schistocephalus solidus]|uniref:V-SNARE coiled-coil homology domain-containing protein n=1 Tax=Schistocephalus solidus TaxID=70667 RepID=A0A3P7CTR5_SCHSO|nr:unnamed protein product [Schistocephalus solidus]